MQYLYYLDWSSQDLSALLYVWGQIVVFGPHATVGWGIGVQRENAGAAHPGGYWLDRARRQTLKVTLRQAPCLSNCPSIHLSSYTTACHHGSWSPSFRRLGLPQPGAVLLFLKMIVPDPCSGTKKWGEVP